jgi:hypothetical protein
MITKNYTGSVDLTSLWGAVKSATGTAAGWYFNTAGAQVTFVYDETLLSLAQAADADAAITAHIAKAPAREHNAPIKQQIAELESQVTDRRIREAVLGTDAGWLKNQDAQISALRATMQPE